jgi:microcystin-dependent protein
MPVTYKDGSANTNGRVMIPGTVLCNGASLNKAQYSELFKVLGTRFGGDGTTFKVPNYSGLYPKSLIGNITSPYTNSTDSKVTLTASNIPTMQVRNTSGSDTSKISITVDTKAISAPAYTTKVWFKTLPTISLSKTVLDNLMKSMLKHYHIPGYLSGVDNYMSAMSVMYNKSVTVKHTGTGGGQVTFSDVVLNGTRTSSIDPGSNSTSVVDSDKKVSYLGIRTTGPIETNIPAGGAAGPKSSRVQGEVYGPPGISWGLTSLGIQSKAIASDIDADLEVTAGEAGSSKYFDARTSTTTNLNHSHTGSLTLSSLKVGTTGSSTTPITIEPSYYKVNTYIYLGQSLVVPETSTTVTIENQGTAYAAPSISPEMYTIETIEE